MSVRRRTLAAASSLAALSLLLAACGGGGDSKSDSSSDEPTDSTSTANALTLSGQWPLTGEKLEGDLPDHPVYVVKIDNTESSAPQLGLGKADMVVEELVEGGLTRLAVFFYQDIPSKVGPVRSMRASDVGIVKPANATVIASGAAKVTTRVINAAHIQTQTEGAPGFSRDSSRLAPYNLFMALSEQADHPAAHWKGPEDTYLQFGDDSDFAGTIPVKSIDAQFSGGHTTTWSYNGKQWTRPDSFAESGDDFSADNVLLLRVKVGDAGYLDPAGNPVPETKFEGKGQGVLVHGSKALPVVWSKAGTAGAVHLKTKNGKEVRVPAGHTWIELVPADTGKVTLSKQ